MTMALILLLAAAVVVLALGAAYFIRTSERRSEREASLRQRVESFASLGILPRSVAPKGRPRGHVPGSSAVGRSSSGGRYVARSSSEDSPGPGVVDLVLLDADNGPSRDSDHHSHDPGPSHDVSSCASAPSCSSSDGGGGDGGGGSD